MRSKRQVLTGREVERKTGGSAHDAKIGLWHRWCSPMKHQDEQKESERETSFVLHRDCWHLFSVKVSFVAGIWTPDPATFLKQPSHATKLCPNFKFSISWNLKAEKNRRNRTGSKFLSVRIKKFRKVPKIETSLVVESFKTDHGQSYFPCFSLLGLTLRKWSAL